MCCPARVQCESSPPIYRYVEETARCKAVEVAAQLGEGGDWAVVIGADTVVVRRTLLPHSPLSHHILHRCWME